MLSASQLIPSCRGSSMALLNTCLTNVHITSVKESEGLDDLLNQILREYNDCSIKHSNNMMNSMENCDSEKTEQNLNALLSSSDSEDSWSPCESDPETVHIKSDWDVTDDIFVSFCVKQEA